MLTMSESVIDLHTHTTFSDGSVSPTELVNLAHKAGARAIAITDHDTIEGLAEGRQAAAEIGIEFIDGIEISAEFSPGTMHILGYGVDPRSTPLRSTLAELVDSRDERNPQIAERLKVLGVDINYEDVVELARGDVVGRPHFARLLVERGYAETIKDAFDRYLAKGAPAYVAKRRLAYHEAIALIHDAGGVAVLAHPYQLALDSLDEVERFVAQLASAGLDGIEAIYSRHSKDERAAYSEMALGLGLLITGGSDYHGSYKPDISIVRGTGDLSVPYSLLATLKERLPQAPAQT